jgi:hypothetical protein
MKKSNGDVRVLGMVAGNHVIEDLGRDVAYRTIVVIPEDQALMSKDLWRGISQGFLFQVPSAPYQTQAAALPDPDRARLDKYVYELEAHVLRLQMDRDRLENEKTALKRQLDDSADHSAKLDAILKAVQSGVSTGPQHFQAPLARPTPHDNDFVDGSAPTFLPAEIHPKDLDARINIRGEEATSGVVSDAADRLRQFRKKDRT